MGTRLVSPSGSYVLLIITGLLVWCGGMNLSALKSHWYFGLERDYYSRAGCDTIMRVERITRENAVLNFCGITSTQYYRS